MATKIPIPRKLTKFIKCSSKSIVTAVGKEEEERREETGRTGAAQWVD